MSNPRRGKLGTINKDDDDDDDEDNNDGDNDDDDDDDDDNDDQCMAWPYLCSTFYHPLGKQKI